MAHENSSENFLNAHFFLKQLPQLSIMLQAPNGAEPACGWECLGAAASPLHGKGTAWLNPSAALPTEGSRQTGMSAHLGIPRCDIEQPPVDAQIQSGLKCKRTAKSPLSTLKQTRAPCLPQIYAAHPLSQPEFVPLLLSTEICITFPGISNLTSWANVLISSH